MDRGESETNYISRFLDQLVNFCHKNNVSIFLVAHHRKMMKERDTEIKKLEVPNLYDINGSANFFNKTDFGLTVYRDFISDKITIYIQKVKFKHLGKVGCIEYRYNFHSGRFDDFVDSPDILDNSNWLLVKNQQIEVKQYELFESTDDCPF